jgi:hypothetical protein
MFQGLADPIEPWISKPVQGRFGSLASVATAPDRSCESGVSSVFRLDFSLETTVTNRLSEEDPGRDSSVKSQFSRVCFFQCDNARQAPLEYQTILGSQFTGFPASQLSSFPQCDLSSEESVP